LPNPVSENVPGPHLLGETKNRTESDLKMNTTALSPLGAARLLGASQRLASDPGRTDRIDRAFSASGQSMTNFVMQAEGTPEQAARDLVRAELVSPENPCAVALSEHAEAGQKGSWRNAADIAGSMMKSASDRGLAVQSAALKRRLSSKGLDPVTSAQEFEKISTAAFAQGDMDTARTAASGFADSVFAGREARDRSRLAPRAPRRDTMEL